MMRGFCPWSFWPEGAYVLMELCMERVLSKWVLSCTMTLHPKTLLDNLGMSVYIMSES